MFPGPLGHSLSGRALAEGELVARSARHPRITPPASTAMSTTRRPAAVPAWSCAPISSRAAIDAAPPERRRAAAPPDEPARQAARPARGCATCRRPRRADPLRPVRGGRRARDRGAWARGSLDRRLRALRRRTRRHGAARCDRPAAARRHGRRRIPAPKRASRAGCSNIRITRGRANGKGGASRRCCFPATMPAIAKWRRAEAERITRERRPDLLSD